jgi:hypothetical protein
MGSSTFNTILIISACCGLLMIVGGMFLIYRGTITLQATPKADALTVRWRKQFVISTQVPAIGFFLIGLVFVVIALWFATPVPDLPLTIQGEAPGIQSPITISVRTDPWLFTREPGGRFIGAVHPNLHVLVVETTAPGYEPVTTYTQDWLKDRAVDLGPINLRQVLSKIHPNPADIEKLPEGFVPPPVSSKGMYGVAR